MRHEDHTWDIGELVLNQLKTAVELGGNLTAFDHFATVAYRYVDQHERHLSIGKNGVMTFARAMAMQFRAACVDYTEFPAGGEDFPQEVRRVGSGAPASRDAERRGYDSVSLFLTLHDYRDFADRLRMAAGILRPGGTLFAVEYDFKPWIGRTADPRGAFKACFSVRNEKAALASEENCFENHTWLGLGDIVRGATSAGLATRHAEAYPLPHPKFCLYIGKK